jgi:hypothetical protein
VAWRYESEQNPKRKHAWGKNVAGFDEYRGVPVGKCPNNISQEDAEQLLNAGIPFSPPGWTEPWPHHIYVVHQGVVYRAVATVPGVSYHAFPDQGRNLRALPASVRTQILTRARELRCEKEVGKWMAR